ncbi:MAG: hypothetical protein JF614_25395 [Acidobacteria bacterium]|nr:hypothetical protein [Acidobacteriota bacterium]
MEAALDLARQEPVLLVTPDGHEFLLGEADDFEKEVEALRNSQAFQRFLDERSRSTGRISLAEIEAESDRRQG